MPGKFVFPGGRVEPEDRRMAAAGALDPDVEAKLNARVRRPSPHFARALALAAIRETFEETGLAIGVADYGAPEDPPPGAWTRFAATGVYPTLDAIDFLARAITPPGRPRRFDARFLIADASLRREARRGRRPSRGRTGRTRLDAARPGAEARLARHHPRRARRPRPGARRRPRQAPPPPVLPRVARQAAQGAALGSKRQPPYRRQSPRRDILLQKGD